jgi:hypothetical protein
MAIRFHDGQRLEVMRLVGDLREMNANSARSASRCAADDE